MPNEITKDKTKKKTKNKFNVIYDIVQVFLLCYILDVVSFGFFTKKRHWEKTPLSFIIQFFISETNHNKSKLIELQILYKKNVTKGLPLIISMCNLQNYYVFYWYLFVDFTLQTKIFPNHKCSCWLLSSHSFILMFIFFTLYQKITHFCYRCHHSHFHESTSFSFAFHTFMLLFCFYFIFFILITNYHNEFFFLKKIVEMSVYIFVIFFSFHFSGGNIVPNYKVFFVVNGALKLDLIFVH